MKCNYDGIFCIDTTEASAVWVIRDDMGIFQGGGQARSRWITSVLEAEQSLLHSIHDV